MEGIVFDIQKFSTFDGPGIRTTVFLKGCMMRCIWCHNPESFNKKIQLSYINSKCTNCKACSEVCSYNVHRFENDEHIVHYEDCVGCGKCVDACLNSCLKLYGKKMSSDQVLEAVLGDKKYYGTTGGVTFSGGEPTMQFEFLVEMMEKCKENNIHVCLETNGIIENENLLKLIPLVDLFLLDYKATGDIHKKLTGVDNSKVFETLSTLNQHNSQVILRCPIIQGVNDQKEHFNKIKEIKKNNSILDVEIMAYHSVGKDKWTHLGYEYDLSTLESASKELSELWKSYIV